MLLSPIVAACLGLVGLLGVSPAHGIAPAPSVAAPAPSPSDFALQVAAAPAPAMAPVAQPPECNSISIADFNAATVGATGGILSV